MQTRLWVNIAQIKDQCTTTQLLVMLLLLANKENVICWKTKSFQDASQLTLYLLSLSLQVSIKQTYKASAFDFKR